MFEEQVLCFSFKEFFFFFWDYNVIDIYIKKYLYKIYIFNLSVKYVFILTNVRFFNFSTYIIIFNFSAYFNKFLKQISDFSLRI